MTAFRDDLDRAADWVEAYLGGVGDRPVSARVEPGAVRAALPASPPEQGEPFEAMLRDLDERDHAGALALEPPALLRVVREHRLRAGRPRASC